MATDCTCFPVENPWTYNGIVEPAGALEPDPYCIEHFPPRWKLACINWGQRPDAPRACAYLLINGEAALTRYFPTWGEAVEWLYAYRSLLLFWGKQLQTAQRGIAYGEDD